MSRSEKTIAYKGFDENFKGQFQQYKVGETYHSKNNQLGFFACANALSVLGYYPAATSRFALVEQSGSLVAVKDKTSSSVIAIKQELTLAEFVRKAVADFGPTNPLCSVSLNFGSCAVSSADESASYAPTDASVAVATGYRSVALSKGSASVSVVTRYGNASVALGSSSASVATCPHSASVVEGAGCSALATGYKSKAQASGAKSTTTVTGDEGSALVEGTWGVSVTTGSSSRAETSGFAEVLDSFEVQEMKTRVRVTFSVGGQQIKRQEHVTARSTGEALTYVLMALEKVYGNKVIVQRSYAEKIGE